MMKPIATIDCNESLCDKLQRRDSLYERALLLLRIKVLIMRDASAASITRAKVMAAVLTLSA